MTKSDSIKNIAEALNKFQHKMEPIVKSASNPFFKSKYADLPSILEAIKEPMKDNGLSITQFPSGTNGLTTLLMHTSGEWIEDTFTMTPVDNKPQTAGSWITYMRRYAIGAVLGLSTEVDDDGNYASGNKKKKVDTDKPPFNDDGSDPDED